MRRHCTVLFCILSIACIGQGLSADTVFVNKVAAKYIDVKGKLTYLEMHLSNLGVEADDFPNIDAKIDLVRLSGEVIKSYTGPHFVDSTYYLDSAQVRNIVNLLQKATLNKLKPYYSSLRTDQATSTTTITTTTRSYTIKDYGLEGDAPLPELYKLVYHL